MSEEKNLEMESNQSILLGDCVSVMKSMDKESIDLAICDPPYGGVIKEKWDIIDDYYEYSLLWIREVLRVLKNDGSIYVWCSIGEKSSSLLDIALILKKYAVFRDMIVWSKQRGRGNRRGWLFTREEILWATKTKDYRWNKNNQYSSIKYHESWIKRLHKEENPYKRSTNVWSDIEEPSIEMARISGGRGKRLVLHPAQKPIAAISRIVLAHTIEGDTVLDPFLGSGTTILACLANKRKCIGIEIDEGYYTLAKTRLQDFLDAMKIANESP